MFVLTALSLIVPGVAVLTSLRMLYSNRYRAADDMLVLVLTIAAWTLVFIGVSMLATPFLMIGVLIVFGMVVAKHREGERKALLWTLSVAADKGLPLAPSARAFAARRCDEMARRAWQLADLLDAGIPLAGALEQSRNPLPMDATLMVRLGADPAATSAALTESARNSGESEQAWRPVFEQTLYLVLVALTCFFVTTFLMVKIIPTFKEIFADYGVELPAVSQLMIAVANSVASYWYIALPFVIYSVCVLFVSAFFYVQGKIWIPWPLSILFGRSDSPNILRGLAICVDQQLPLDQALYRLGHHYPRPVVRERLWRCAETTSAGGDWCQSLCDENVVTKAESAVLKAATRAGNLPWALREVAEATNRRLVYRARTFLNILTPVCLLAFAIPVALIAFGCMMPLAELIYSNSLTGM